MNSDGLDPMETTSNPKNSSSTTGKKNATQHAVAAMARYFRSAAHHAAADTTAAVSAAPEPEKIAGVTKKSSMLKNFQEMLLIFFLNIPFICNEEDISLHYSNFPKCSNCSSQRETPERVTHLVGNPQPCRGEAERGSDRSGHVDTPKLVLNPPKH